MTTREQAAIPSGAMKHHTPLKRLSLNEPFASLHPKQILLFPEWCELNRISERTGRRILASSKGPAVTQLSRQRIGITIENNARWQASKARKRA